MRILFIHNNFPAQYRRVAQALAADPSHQVVFATKNTDVTLPGIHKVVYAPSRDAHDSTHFYVRPFESAVLHGQAVFRLAEQLKAANFVPDIICGHSGWGPCMFIKDAFPQVPLLCYFEWFTNAHGSDADFDPAYPPTSDDILRYRASNASLLIDLQSCDWGLSPTHWQRTQFPQEFHPKISVLHDGVDTEFFCPRPGARLVLPPLDLSAVDELVTYVARGMDLYRGFPQFMEAIALVLQRRPRCHVAIVAGDRVAYGKPHPDGISYKEAMLNRLDLDRSRVHFLGTLPYSQYLQVIQASSVHIYLTRPFVLSWSLLEALSTGCLVIASDTAPVTEVIRDGDNGLLVDFFSPSQIADRVDEVLDHPTRLQAIRDRARSSVVDHYALAQLLPRHIQLLTDIAQGKIPPG
ncbi:MAG TPA: glycosyltransferase family 4 protein [Chroococcidiopsis sp.]